MSTIVFRRSGTASIVLASMLGVLGSACGGGSAGTAAASAPPAAVASGAAPQGSGGELAEADEHRDHHHGGVEMLIAMSIRDLELSPDQRATVEKIRTDVFAKMEPARAAGRDLANLLADGVAAGSIDKAKVDQAVEKLTAQAQGLRDASLDAMNQLHAALNPQQRAALVGKLNEHWDKWKAAHGQDESEDHQHRSGYLLALVRELGLTQDQAQRIKAAFHEQMKSRPQDHQHREVQDHVQAFATAFAADGFDAKSLTSGSTADAHMARWGTTRRAAFLEAAVSVLTPDQRTKLAQAIRREASTPDR